MFFKVVSFIILIIFVEKIQPNKSNQQFVNLFKKDFDEDKIFKQNNNFKNEKPLFKSEMKIGQKGKNSFFDKDNKLNQNKELNYENINTSFENNLSSDISNSNTSINLSEEDYSMNNNEYSIEVYSQDQYYIFI